jgi:succinyl-CoA synthetase beta subunit
MLTRAFRPFLSKPLTTPIRRFFDLHEYQSKDLMRKYGVLVQRGDIATTPDQAEKVARDLNVKDGILVLKAQVHAGGRGKGTLSSGLKGGVQILKTPQEVAEKTAKMIGYNLKTHQTTGDGLKVNAVLIHEGVDIERQIYLAFILDRNSQRPAIVASIEGGVEIEEVAKNKPDAVKVYPLEVDQGVTEDILNQLEKELQLQNVKGFREQVRNLYNMFVKCDCVQLEINPWAVNPQNEVYSVDAKISIDDNAKFRQKELEELKRNSLCAEDIDPHEDQAIAAGLNYVALDGNIGCMVNGAGLAMATMDIIKLKGGDPANFLDVGGGANVEQVKTAFEILSSHPKVKTILINIFGGIMKCDTIATGIIKAAQLVDLRLPLVCRLTGTNADKANAMLKEFTEKNTTLKIEVASDLDDAAVKAVRTAAQQK